MKLVAESIFVSKRVLWGELLPGHLKEAHYGHVPPPSRPGTHTHTHMEDQKSLLEPAWKFASIQILNFYQVNYLKNYQKHLSTQEVTIANFKPRLDASLLAFSVCWQIDFLY